MDQRTVLEHEAEARRNLAVAAQAGNPLRTQGSPVTDAASKSDEV